MWSDKRKAVFEAGPDKFTTLNDVYPINLANYLVSFGIGFRLVNCFADAAARNADVPGFAVM